MTVEQFLIAYANTPLEKRFKKLGMKEQVDYREFHSLSELNSDIKDLANQIRTLKNRQQHVINIAEKYL